MRDVIILWSRHVLLDSVKDTSSLTLASLRQRVVAVVISTAASEAAHCVMTDLIHTASPAHFVAFVHVFRGGFKGQLKVYIYIYVCVAIICT